MTRRGAARSGKGLSTHRSEGRTDTNGGAWEEGKAAGVYLTRGAAKTNAFPGGCSCVGTKPPAPRWLPAPRRPGGVAGCSPELGSGQRPRGALQEGSTVCISLFLIHLYLDPALSMMYGSSRGLFCSAINSERLLGKKTGFVFPYCLFAAKCAQISQ